MVDDREEKAARGERAKKVGRIVEKDFSSWCTKNDLTTNKAEEDDEGWDFFVQSKAPHDRASFFDAVPPGLAALVQVKGSENNSGQFRMSLANALKLTRHLGPAFVFVATLAGSDIDKAFLVHWGKRQMRCALRAAAKPSLTGRPLNKRMMTFTPLEEEAVTREHLRRELERHATKNSLRYVRTKEHYFRTVGYTDAAAEVSVRFRKKMTAADYTELADVAIGLQKTIKPDAVNVYDLRFGGRRHVAEHEQATIELPGNAGTDATLTITAPEGQRVDVRCKMRVASSVFPFLPRRYDRVRVSAPFLELLVYRDLTRRNATTLAWKARDLGGVITRLNLEDMARAAKAMRLLRALDATAHLTVGGIHRQLHVGGALRASHPNAVAFATALENLQTVVHGFGLPLDAEEFDMPSLLRASTRLALFAAVASQSDTRADFRIPTTALSVQPRNGEQCAFVLFQRLGFAAFTLVLVAAVVGKARRSTGGWMLRATRLRRLAHHVLASSDPVVEKRMVENGVKTLRDEGFETIFSPHMVVPGKRAQRTAVKRGELPVRPRRPRARP